MKNIVIYCLLSLFCISCGQTGQLVLPDDTKQEKQKTNSEQ